MNAFSPTDELPTMAVLFGSEPGMDLARVEELMELLPVEWFLPPATNGTPASHRLQAAQRRRAQLRFDPAFAWHFVALHAARGEPLPWSVTEDALRHAYDYHATGHVSAEFTAFLAIAGNRHLAAVLKALLLCPDVQPSDVAALLKVPVCAVEWFALLLWNVHYRRDERAFVLSIVLPDGLRGAWDEDRHAPLEQLLLQTAYSGGQRAVLQALGARPESGEAGSLADLESLTVEEAMRQARQGGLTRRPTTAMREAFRLMQSEKIHRLRYGDPDNDPERDSLMSLSRRFAVLDQVKAMQRDTRAEFLSRQSQT
ncbi:MAG: hypothetical protein ABMA26_06205 [Limisphaerales bacterium]